MIPELGHFALIIALLLSIALVIVPIAGSYIGNNTLMHSSRSLSAGIFVFLTIAFALLVWSFLQDDFSVQYVANHSNRELPVFYKASAVWGGHEGSILLWIFMLSAWTVAVALLGRSLPLEIHARVLGVMGFVNLGFLAFMIFTSNPFDRILPGAPLDGSDLNPLLQDFFFIIHPPILFMGYVGFSVAFAFAIACLMSGQVDTAWTRWSRPWTNVAWAFLSLGIGLGSWWAYHELGWGGLWFWDPVENASFMPWLAGTALIHSLAVTEKRGIFKAWTILLSITVFSMILLAAFLVRSDVVTSVHAFASDPARGAFLLGFLAVSVGGGLLIYALKAPNVKATAVFSASGKETFLLANNILLVITMLMVLIGTIFPILAGAFGQKPSVGAPWFNLFFGPLVAVSCLILGLSVFSQWRNTALSLFRRFLSIPLVVSLLLGALLPLFTEEYSIGGAIALFCGFWVLGASFSGLIRQWKSVGVRGVKTNYYCMSLGHIGLAIAVLGGGMAHTYSEESVVIVEPQETVSLFGYDFTFNGMRRVPGPNYTAEETTIEVYQGNQLIYELTPQKRFYNSGGGPMTETGIGAGVFRDIVITLEEPIAPMESGKWAINFQTKAFIRFFWGGIALMALAGFMSLVDRRYRMKVRQQDLDEAEKTGFASNKVASA